MKVTSLLNCRLTPATNFHDMMHGFGVGGGMGTVSLEAKLLQQLTAMREAVLFEVFLGLKKAYYALDQIRCLEIITAYGFVPRTL